MKIQYLNVSEHYGKKFQTLNKMFLKMAILSLLSMWVYVYFGFSINKMDDEKRGEKKLEGFTLPKH